MNMRKIIAVLSAVLLLCAAIPMSVMPVTAATSDNLVVNGDFENGSEGWTLNSAGSIIAEDDGNNALQMSNPTQWSSVALQTVAVQANTTYKVTWQSKRLSGSGAFNLYMMNGSYSNLTTSGQNWMNSTSTDWVDHTMTVTTDSETLILKFSSETASAGEILIDNVKVYIPPVVTNGDFETGDAEGWETWQSTVISADAAYEGSYGANLIGNGGWGGMLNQTFPVTDGKTYELSFWYKVNSQGVNYQFDGTSSGTRYASGWVTTTEWTQVTKTVIVSGDSGLKLNFCGGGTGVAEDVYVDNVTLTEVKDPSDDGYIKNGDFETGKIAPWTVYSDTAISEDAAYEGDYGMAMIGAGGWGGLLYQDFTVEVGKTYVVNMMLKAVANGVNIQIKDNGSTVAGNWFTTTEWTLKSYEFTAASTTARINICGGGNNLATTVYVDNIEVIELKEPSYDGYLYNGDFEAGSLTKWSVYQSTVLSRDAAYSGNFGANLKGTGGWGAFIEQTTSELVTGLNYNLTFWYKANAQGANWTLKQDGTTIDGCSGYISKSDWTQVSVDFTAPADGVAILNFCGSGTGAAEDLYLDDVVIKVLPCDECTYDDCTDAECNVCGTTRETPAHSYTDNCDWDCDVCGEYRNAPHTLTEYVDEVVPANCQETGHPGYWICADCSGYFKNADGTGQLNPGWMYYAGEHVRPEGTPGCATVACELCSEDSYGSEQCVAPDGTPACQNSTCVNCDGIVYGCGHTYATDDEGNYVTPLCQPGECVYCGEQLEKIYDCENNTWAPCIYDGECSYGCGKQYPATGIHAVDDPCAGGTCWQCYQEIEGAHTYDDEYDATCNVCSATREVPEEPVEIVYGDANGDGVVDTLDEVLLSQYLAEWDVELDEAAADANGDGVVDTLDEVLLSQYLAEWDVVLGG